MIQSSTERLDLPLPHLADQFLLRRDVAFLNHGSFGACPRPVFETYQNWQRELETQPVDFMGRKLPDLLTAARHRLAEFIGAGDDDVVFVPNVTHAINIVARSLQLEPGDEVLTTDHEYGAVNNTWNFNCEKWSARYVQQPIPVPLQDPAEVVDALWAGVTPRTKVIALSHITSPTAVRFPVAEVCRRARAAGITTVIDGAHAPGQIELDMQAIGADFYGGNCHKWLCAPKGAGFLYVRPDRQPEIEPLVVSHGWSSVAYRGSTSRYINVLSWTGTSDPAAYLSVPTAIDFMAENDWPQVRAACHRLGAAVRRRIHTAFGTTPLYPDATTWWSQMFVATLPDGAVETINGRLWSEHRVEAPVLQWQDQSLVRVSVQAYNTPEQLDQLQEGLHALLAGD